MKVICRELVAEDLPFIKASWPLSYAADRPAHGDRWLLRIGVRTVIAELRACATTEFAVACIDEDPDVIVGWTCFDRSKSAVHYMFVKHSLRRQGIASIMFEHINMTEAVYTFQTSDIRAIRMPDGWRFDNSIIKSKESRTE